MPYAVDFTPGSTWNSGFVASVVIRNDNPSASNGWKIEFYAPFEITNIWNATIVSRVNGVYTIANAGWNGTIGANGSVEFGFQASGAYSVPSGVQVNDEDVGGPAPAPPVLSIGDATVTEGDAGTRSASFVVSLSKAATDTVTVAYATANGTAVAGSDYTARTGTVVFAPGETSKTVAVSVLGDTSVEPNETFSVALSNAAKATIGKSAGTGTIVNDDAASRTLQVADASLNEGTGGAKTATLTVTLSAAAASNVTVAYATQNGTALAGSDYTAVSGVLTFSPGQTSRTISVPIITDSVVEANETFRLNLSNASGATIADAQAIVTIANDDAAARPTLSVSDVTVTEGSPSTTGGVGAGFWRTQGNDIVDAAGKDVKIAGVNWFGMESDRYAPDGLHARNYKAMMDQMADLGFNAIRLPFSSQLFESASRPNGINYNLNPDLQNLNGLQIMDKIVAYAGDIGMKIILDHHRPSAGAGASQNGLWYDGTYTEAKWIQTWTMLATRYATDDTVIGADLHNEPHAATWGGGGATDWAAAAERAGNAALKANPNWLIFVEGVANHGGQSYWWGGNLMGVKDRPIQLDVANRVVYSAHDYPNSIYNQPWFNDPSFPNNLTAKFDQMWGYIERQNIAPVFIGEMGSRLTDPKDVAWLDKLTKYLAGDYDANGARDMPAGEVGANWTWWSWNPNSGDTGGILKDDWTSVHANKVAALEPIMFDFGGTGSVDGVTDATFRVTLSAAAAGAVSVAYATVAGTAGASDFTPVSGTLTFAPGETAKSLTVKVRGDATPEGDETFQLVLSSPVNADIADGTGVGRILDDDAGASPAPAEPDPAGLVASVAIDNAWADGATASVTIRNPGDAPVDDWVIRLDTDAKITDIWNAELVGRNGDDYLISGADWNDDLPAGDEVAFGFNAQGAQLTADSFEWSF